MGKVYSVSELSEMLRPVFNRYGVRKAVLFGSYGRGTATESSDIDLLVDSRLRGLRFVGFIEDVRRTVGSDVDLLDITHIEKGSRVEREIARTGVTVYEK